VAGVVRILSSLSTTKTASRVAGSVALALALILWKSPGSSVKFAPLRKTRTGPPLIWLSTAPSSTVA
jgi:hypothetical protein